MPSGNPSKYIKNNILDLYSVFTNNWLGTIERCITILDLYVFSLCFLFASSLFCAIIFDVPQSTDFSDCDIIGKGCLQNKKNGFKDIVPIKPDTPLHSHFGTSTFGTFELGFGPPPTYQNLGRNDKNFGLITHYLTFN